MDLVYTPDAEAPPARPEVPGMPTWRRVPLMDAKDEDILQYVARINNPKSTFRRWRMALAAQNQRFYQGEQWSWPEIQLSAHSGAYRFEFDKRFPQKRRLTTNRVRRAADNEKARIGRWEYVPSIGPASGLPEVEAAARSAKHYVLARLVKIAWAAKRDEAIGNVVIHGTTGAVARYVESNLNLKVESEAVACSGCGAKLATRRYPASILAAVPFNQETIQEVPTGAGEEPQVNLTHCPVCPHPMPLEDHIPTVREAQTEADLFGNPLGLTLPKGESNIDIIPMFRLYVENGGLGVEPHNCKIWGIKTPMSMEDFATRYGHLVDVEKIHPTSASKIFQDDPFLGCDDAFHHNPTTDAGIYDNHVVVDEVCCDPTHGLELGRQFVVADGQVIVNGELLKEFTPEGTNETRTVALAKFAAARYIRIPGIFWGDTPFNDAISPQRRRNEIDTMQSYLREHGVPHLFLPPNVDPKFREDIEGLALRAFELEGAPPGWTLKDALFPGTPITGNIYETESRKADEDIMFVFGPSAIESADVGRLGPAAQTASGLHLLTEEAAQQRGPVEGEIVRLCEPLWTHILESTWAFQTDEDEYEIKSATGRRELRQFKGVDLMGQTNVYVEKENKTAATVKLIEGTKAAIEAGLMNPGDPVEAEQARKNLGLPSNVGEARSVQIQRAEDAWQDFRTKWKVPAIDEVLHEAQTWKSVLGKRWLGDEAVELQKELGWDRIIASFDGWQRKLAMAVEDDAKQRAIYEGYAPQEWGQIYLEAAQKQADVLAAQAEAQKAAAEAVTTDVPPAPQASAPAPAIPKPPATGQFLPEAPDKRIAFVLERMAGLPPLPDEYEVDDPGLPDQVAYAAKLCKMVRFYAVILGYDRLVKQALAPGAPIQGPAPGGVAETMPGVPGPQMGGPMVPPPQMMG